MKTFDEAAIMLEQEGFVQKQTEFISEIKLNPHVLLAMLILVGQPGDFVPKLLMAFCCGLGVGREMEKES